MTSKAKLIAVALIVALAAIHLLNTGYRDWNAGADTAYVMGLLFLFFAREKPDDERVQSLKLRAMFVAFMVGWAVTGAIRFAVYLQDRSVAPKTMSAFDAMFVILVVGHGLFQYWRFQDGRENDDAGVR